MSAEPMEECPICFKPYPSALLERHVNSCLDTQETVPSNTSDATQPTQPTQVAGDGLSNEGSSKSSGSQNPFAALGLKLDSSGSKKGKSDIKSGKVKEKATLTSILIAERRLKRKQEELERSIAEKETQAAPTAIPTPPIASAQPVVPTKKPKLSKSDSLTEQSDAEQQQTPISSPPRSEYLKRNQEFLKFKREASLPLAQRLRPKSLDEFYGQEKLVGTNGLLRNIINAEQIPSFILWGVPGVGKTSLARIIANTSSYKFVEVSGADSNAKKLREAFTNAENEKHLTGRKTILFLDEIHRFNKGVQDLLLPVIERGLVTVIGATTENPSFNLNNALLSRMHTFVMEPLPHKALVRIINRGLLLVNKTRNLVHKLHIIALNKESIDYIAKLSTGDSRVALNILESINAYLSGRKYHQFESLEEAETKINFPEKNVGVIKITLENLKPLLSTKNYHQMYDKQGESHYDTISAFHKSVRGSNADAAVFYLTKMLSGGEDPLFIARRMIVIASEDIGLRDSSCLPFAISVLEAIQFIGMPEGEIILAHCAIKLARSPKSTKSYRALRTCQNLLREQPEITQLPIPLHLRNAPTKLMKDLGYSENYKYNPNFKFGEVKQLYFPEGLLEKETKFIEDTHLGGVKDPDIPVEKYYELEDEENEYKEYKKFKKDKLRTLNKEKIIKNRIINRHKLFEQDEAIEITDEDTPRFSYDENLSKLDQPEYFDGHEKDEYSEDSECSDNFEKSYDEFQKDYNEDLEYPIM